MLDCSLGYFIGQEGQLSDRFTVPSLDLSCRRSQLGELAVDGTDLTFSSFSTLSSRSSTSALRLRPGLRNNIDNISGAEQR